MIDRLFRSLLVTAIGASVVLGIVFFVKQYRKSHPVNVVGWHIIEFRDPSTWIAKGPLRFSDLRGNVVLVSFRTLECQSCDELRPDLIKFDEQYRARGLTIIEVIDGTDNTLQQAQAWANGTILDFQSTTIPMVTGVADS
jgi:hypothetical protein